MAAVLTGTSFNGDKFTIKKTVDLVYGNGAPTNGDVLCTQVVKYPLGTQYIDFAGSKLLCRVAVAGVAADFKGVAIA